jgi:adenylate kinase
LHLVLLGAPGTGKGTQAKLLMARFGWPHISTGDMLREAVTSKSELGKAAKSYMDQGALVPDELVIKMLIERIQRPDAADGFILDGFPRTLAQAQALDDELSAHGRSMDVSLNLCVAREDLVRRLSSRWSCPKCGAIYNLLDHPPKKEGVCDRCGATLFQREDDRPETVEARLDRQFPPADLLAHYRRQGKLVEVDGSRSVADVTESLVERVESLKSKKQAER